MKIAIQQAVKQAMTVVKPLNSTVVYHSTGTFKKHPVTGIMVESGGADYTSTDMTMVGYKSNEIDGTHVLSTDQKGLISTLVFTDTPKNSDYLTDEDSIKWNVESHKKDPAKALWIIQLRKP